MQAEPATPVDEDQNAPLDRRAALRAWWTVILLTLAYICSFIDRQVITLLIGPIKQDLGLSDTQVSYLIGLSFALFYTVFGFLIAIAADRLNRRNIIAAGIFLWTIMTAACGLARGYGQLFLARMGVGFGEGALSPAALSLLTDLFPRRQLARAIGVYSTGIAIGSGVALLVGGSVIQAVSGAETVTLPLFGTLRPWQAAFIIVSLPGLPIGLLMLTLREPARKGMTQGAGWSLKPTLAHLREHWRSYLGIALGMSVLTIMAYGIIGWIPEHFRRSYGWSIGQLSLWYGLVLVCFGPPGAFLGGWLADRWRERHADGYLRAALVGLALLGPAYALFALMTDPWMSLLWLIPATVGGAIPTSVVSAALMQLAPADMRARISALYYFVISIVGLGIGPTSIALLTDYWFADEGMLRYSIATVASLAALAATGLLIWVRPHFTRSVLAARAWNG
ncbi:MAG: spinster family MFS transporter [Steroidobacteraceae bacterium]